LTGSLVDVGVGASGGLPTVGASTVAWFDEPLQEALAKAGALVPLVEIFSAYHQSLLNPANLKAALACGSRLTVHAPWEGLDLASLDEDLRRAAVATHQREVERAAAVGAELYVVHPDTGTERGNGWSRSAARAALARSFADLLEIQESHGVPVAVENLPDPRTSLFTAPGLDLGGLGFTLDAGHAALAGSLDEFLGAVDGLCHMHLHDNLGPQDFVDRHLALGEGVVDVVAALRVADATGVSVVLEVVDEEAVVRSLAQIATFV